jgi:hypothetical protein
MYGSLREDERMRRWQGYPGVGRLKGGEAKV